MSIKKILNYLLIYPHYKMNIFSGINSFEEIKNIYNKLNSINIVKGKDIEKYEIKLKNRLNSKSIYTFASGRMGFYAILKAINIQKGDEIIIPSYTCVVVPNAILYSDALPIYCDIKSDDFNIDISKIEALITPKTKVLYAQHTFGQMCDIEKIMQIAEKYNLLVVEDAALSFGAKIENKYAGTIGDFGYYSTDRSKVINTGLGGIVSVNTRKYVDAFNEYYDNVPFLDKSYTKKIANTLMFNLITLHPSFYWLGKFINITLSKLYLMTYFLDESLHNLKDIKSYPYPAKLSNILASIGISQIDHLDCNLSNRKKVVQFYNKILNIYSHKYIESNENIFLRYSFLVKNRDYWEKKFDSKIDLSIWFKSIASGKTDNFEEINYKIGMNNVSEYTCKHIFNLPTHNNIKPEKLEKLLNDLKNSGDIITRERIL